MIERYTNIEITMGTRGTVVYLDRYDIINSFRPLQFGPMIQIIGMEILRLLANALERHDGGGRLRKFLYKNRLGI